MKVLAARTATNLEFPRYAYDGEQGLVRLDSQQDLIFLTRFLPQNATIDFVSATKLRSQARHARKYAGRDADIERRQRRLTSAETAEAAADRIERGSVPRVESRTPLELAKASGLA